MADTRDRSAEEYRRRALEARQKADTTASPAMRRDLLDIAATLERWADDADRRAVLRGKRRAKRQSDALRRGTVS